ncbi:hypothetical protein CRUP_007638 [Coryphaenoides rupestris]|nr:hypothetical protein CRUP_007638 [Coryphaenoides rupestris]
MWQPSAGNTFAAVEDTPDGLTVISKPSPLSKSVQALQGDKVTLSCNYSSANYFFWYRQYPSSPPQFLIKEHMKISGFTLKKDEERKVFQLEISSAAVTDSALYYCAVQPTAHIDPNLDYGGGKRRREAQSPGWGTPLFNVLPQNDCPNGATPKRSVVYRGPPDGE